MPFRLVGEALTPGADGRLVETSRVVDVHGPVDATYVFATENSVYRVEVLGSDVN
jgi:hypothetical protein